MLKSIYIHVGEKGIESRPTSEKQSVKGPSVITSWKRERGSRALEKIFFKENKIHFQYIYLPESR